MPFEIFERGDISLEKAKKKNKTEKKDIKTIILVLVLVFITAALTLVALLYKNGMFDMWIYRPKKVVVELMEDADIIFKDINLSFMKDNYSEYVPDTEQQFKKNEKMYEEIVDIINKYRYEAKKEGLVVDNELMMIAQIRAEEIAKNKTMSHTRPDGNYFSSLYNEYGWNRGQVGENIAWGYKTAEEVCEQWKLSSTHYENLKDAKWTKTGIGIATYEDGTYVFVQEFSNASTDVQTAS